MKAYTKYKLKSKLTQSEVYSMFSKVFQFVNFNKVEGDYLEFGTYQGNSLIGAYMINNPMNPDREYYAFDSFEGLPESEGVFQEGEYSATLGQLRANLIQQNVDQTKIQIVKGWYESSLNEMTQNAIGLQQAAVIMVDCDLYSSTKYALEFITDLVQDGTVIIFDDWFCFNGRKDQGEQKAFREWLQNHPEITATQYIQYGFAGNSFILNRKI